MKKNEKAVKIEKILNRLYPIPKIPLHHTDPFSLLIATVLSAQTTDKQVNRVTPPLFACAATPDQMASLEVSQIERTIRALGLSHTKAKNIRALSKILVNEYDGSVPADMKALESLPGVGHKTASVVLAQAYGVPCFPVDTHIHRLATRWGLTSGRNVVQTERDLKRVFPQEKWNKLHLQIIYFGREHCPARNHDMSNCMICSWAATKKRIHQESQKAVSHHG